MKVYLAVRSYDYEGDQVLGVFDSHDKAVSYLVKEHDYHINGILSEMEQYLKLVGYYRIDAVVLSIDEREVK